MGYSMTNSPFDINQRNITIIAIVLVAAATIFAFFILQSPDTTTQTNNDDLTAEVKIGSLLPLTGDLSSNGEENKLAIDLAVDDFNTHLKEIDANWHLKVVHEDTATSPVIALEKLTSLYSKGVNVVVGPSSSAELRVIKAYADSNGIVLISPSSTAPSLAIPGDNVFRLITDDTKQGPAIAKLLSDQKIKVIVPAWRGDTWGDGLSSTAVNSFEKLGGISDKGIRYNPESPEFSAATSLLAGKVQFYVDKHGAANVGVLFLGFAEILQFMQSASEHDSLDDVRWFGSDANTKEHKLTDDPIGLEFSNNVLFTTTQGAVMDNPVYESVNERIVDKLGRDPIFYAFSSYDAVWLAGKSILDAQSTNANTIKDAIMQIAEKHNGAIGSTRLNDAGDLEYANYEIWGIRGDDWVLVGLYDSESDSIIKG